MSQKKKEKIRVKKFEKLHSRDLNPQRNKKIELFPADLIGTQQDFKTPD